MDLVEHTNSSHQRALGINLLLCVTSVCIFFGGTELLARVWYSPEITESDSGFEFDNEKMFRLKGNANSEYFGVPYSTNSFGHRSPEISVEKPKDTFRVLVVGDSIAFGFQVLDHETFSAYLEQKLNNYFNERNMLRTAQVINTAVPGNAPFQEYYDLKRGLKFKPDVVLLQLTLNDVVETEYQRLFPLQVSGFSEEQLSEPNLERYIFGETPISLAFRMNYALKQHSALYLLFKDTYGRIKFKDPSGVHIASKAQEQERLNLNAMVSDPTHPQVESAWEQALKWTKSMTDLAKEENIPLVILFTPFSFQMEQEMSLAEPQRVMKKFSREQNVPYVDLLNVLQNQYAKTVGETEESTEEIISGKVRSAPHELSTFWSGFFFDVCHALPSGHELIANILQPTILGAMPK